VLVWRVPVVGAAAALVVVSGISLALPAVENAALLSMLSRSRDWAAGGAVEATPFQGLAGVVGAGRRWAHFTHLLLVGGWMLTLFALLGRAGRMPRLLAGLGMLAVVLQVTGVPLRAILGFGPITALAVPLAPVYLAVAIWLLVKGLPEQP